MEGNDIRNDMGVVYGLMGVCPQEDLLWETLTARDHLLFYGRLKNLKVRWHARCCVAALANRKRVMSSCLLFYGRLKNFKSRQSGCLAAGPQPDNLQLDSCFAVQSKWALASARRCRTTPACLPACQPGNKNKSIKASCLQGRELDGAVEAALRSVNLWNGGVADKQVRAFSGGMKRRLSVAISFMGDPLVVYLDEPSTVSDHARNDR